MEKSFPFRVRKSVPPPPSDPLRKTFFYSSPLRWLPYASFYAGCGIAMRCDALSWAARTSAPFLRSAGCMITMLRYLHSNYYSNFGPISVHRLPAANFKVRGWVNKTHIWELISYSTYDWNRFIWREFHSHGVYKCESERKVVSLIDYSFWY